jgi:hypothetical protein
LAVLKAIPEIVLTLVALGSWVVVVFALPASQRGSGCHTDVENVASSLASDDGASARQPIGESGCLAASSNVRDNPRMRTIDVAAVSSKKGVPTTSVQLKSAEHPSTVNQGEIR